MSRPAEPLADRLRRYVTEPDQNGCRLWLGYTNPQSGYGQITLSKRDIPVFGSRIATAPVVACTIAHGPRPDGLVVLHSCDVRRCCEPSHLRWGTPRANCREAWDRGGRKSGELHHRATLTDSQVSELLGRAHRGERVYALANEYCIDVSHVYKWLRGAGRGVQLGGAA